MTNPITEQAYHLGKRTPRSKEAMITVYQNNIQQFGFKSRTLLYSDEIMHAKKLRRYCELLPDFVKPGDSLLDIGCGYGSLYGQLITQLARCEYRGIDIVPEFIEHAMHTYRGMSAVFQVLDLEHYSAEVDWCVLLGVVNSISNPEQVVDLAWRKCRKGLFVDFNSIEKIGMTQYNTFDIRACEKSFEAYGAVKIHDSDIWDGCTLFIVLKEG